MIDVFVGRFVLQKNILPIKNINRSYSTCIGELNLSFDKSISTKSVCMFDKNAIYIEPDINGLFTIVSKEYRINNYIYTVIFDALKLNVEIDLKTKLSIGEKCKVKFISGKEFLVLPEKINSKF